MNKELGSELYPHATDTYEMIHGGLIEKFKGTRVSIIGTVGECNGSVFMLHCLPCSFMCGDSFYIEGC